MTKYRNHYLKIQIDFPVPWRFRCWSNWKKIPENIESFQVSDSDFPKAPSGYKTLVRGFYRDKSSPSMISAEVTIDSHFRHDEFFLPKEVNTLGRLNERYSSLEILGKEGGVLDFELDGGGYLQKCRVYSWPERSNIWLSVFLSGDTESNFALAESVYHSMFRD